MASIFQFKRSDKPKAKPFKRVLPSEQPMDLFDKGFWIFLKNSHGMVMHEKAAQFHSQPRGQVILAKLGHYDYWAKEFPRWWRRYLLHKQGIVWQRKEWQLS